MNINLLKWINFIKYLYFLILIRLLDCMISLFSMFSALRHTVRWSLVFFLFILGLVEAIVFKSFTSISYLLLVITFISWVSQVQLFIGFWGFSIYVLKTYAFLFNLLWSSNILLLRRVETFGKAVLLVKKLQNLEGIIEWIHILQNLIF